MKDITKWDPFKEVVDLGSVIDRFFGRGPLSRRNEDFNLYPAIEITDKKDKLVVKAEIPGVDKKDIKVSLEGDILTIKGEVKKEEETKEKGYYYSERSYGTFQRSISLPYSVDKKKIDATYKDGVLTIELPKSETAKETEIEVK